MRKITLLFLAIILTFSLGSCAKEEELLEITADSLISMENLDDYLYREDVQYVDLRNHQAHFKYGYIDGFENIPFFDYLDYRAFDRGRTYEFNSDQLKDTSILERVFEREKAIFLYADGCIRSGYIKDALNYLGYERVFVIGGYYEYLGDNKVYGDGSYDIGNTYYSSVYDEDSELRYVMYGEYDVAKNILSLHIDVYNSSNKSVRKDADYLYDDELTIIENHIVTNIYNYNEIVDFLIDDSSDISNLENIDWDELSILIDLFKEQYRG